MALITAKATGNWSAGSTWNSDPALPSAGDTVDCAGYVVTIDQNVTVALIKSTGAGYFAVSAARTINAAILSDTGHSGNGVVRCTHTTGTVTITGDVIAGSSLALSHSAAGTINVTGNVTGGTSASSPYGITNTGAGTINVTGDVAAGSGSNPYGIQHSGTGVVTVTGNVTAGPAYGGIGIRNGGIGTVNVNGNVTGGSNTLTYGVQNVSTGIVNVDGICYPGTYAGGIGLYGTVSGGTTTYKKAVIGGALGSPVAGYVKLLVDAANNYVETVRSDTGAAYKLSNNYPANAQVESGVVFHLGTQTGTYAGGSTVIVIED